MFWSSTSVDLLRVVGSRIGGTSTSLSLVFVLRIGGNVHFVCICHSHKLILLHLSLTQYFLAYAESWDYLSVER